MKIEKKQIHGLTIFRFVAAFYVFTFHCNIIFNVSHDVPLWLYMILRNGAIGMTFFFVLSGFVMAWAHRDEVGDNYFRKRFLRIYPAYLFMGFLTIPFLEGYDTGKLLSTLALYFTGTQAWYSQAFSIWNFIGSWSVSTELFFYAMFPFIYDIVKKNPLIFLVGSWVVSSAIIPISMSLNGLDMMPAYYISPMHRIPEFIFGMSIGFIFSNGFRIKWTPISIGLIACSLYVLGTYVTLFNNSFMLNNYMTVPATGLIIICLASMNINKNIITRPFIYLGEVSYSFYLMYIPLVMYISKYKEFFHGMPNWQMWAIMFTLNFVMASISYEFVEKRFAFKKAPKEVRA